jgi:hypothetical protein
MASGEVPVSVPEPEVEPEPEPFVPEPEEAEPISEAPAFVEVIQKRTAVKSIGSNYEDTLTKLRERYTNAKTFDANKRELDTLYRITDTLPKDCISCLNDTPYVNALIRNRRRKNGQPYKGTSIKLIFATLVVLCDPANGFYTNITKQARDFYLKEKNVFDAQYARETAEHNRTFVLNKGYEQLLQEAGQVSKTDKFYVFLTLYKYAMCRDNFRYLKVVKTRAQAVQQKPKANRGKEAETAEEPVENFLVLPVSDKASGMIVLNQYKTKGLYGQMEIEIPPSAVAIAKGYGVSYGDYLFGTQPNSTFIAQKLKEFGVKDPNVKGSINLLRKMVLQQYSLTDTDDPEAIARDNIAKAQRMGHTVATQQAVYTFKNQPRQSLKAVPKPKK